MLAAMITIEGAGLLAQFIPVLVLILAVERRTLGPEEKPVRLIGWIWYFAKGIGQSIGAGVALVCMGPLIIYVNAGESIDGFWAWMTIASTVLTGQAVVGIVVSLVMKGYFGDAQFRRGAEIRRAKAVEARKARRASRSRRLASGRIDAP